MSTKSSEGPRERLLDAANRLFYDEGIHTVGIDRLIEEAGVAKASLYSVFGSKDELVVAYLTQRKEAQAERIRGAIAAHKKPRARILAIFDAYAEAAQKPGYRGCAFTRSRAERGGTDAGRAICDASRAFVRSTFTDLARELGAKHPERLARQLVVLHDGVAVAAQMDGGPAGHEAARAVVEMLLDAAKAG